MRGVYEGRASGREDAEEGWRTGERVGRRVVRAHCLWREPRSGHDAHRERERESNGLSGEIDMCLCVRACVCVCLSVGRSVGRSVGGHVCVGVWCVCPKAYLASEEGLEPDAPSTLHALKRPPCSSTSTRHFRTTNALCGCSHSAYSAIPGSISMRLRGMRRPLRSVAAAPMPASAKHMAPLLRQ